MPLCRMSLFLVSLQRMLSVNRLSAIMLTVIIQNVILMRGIMQNVNMLSVFRLSAFMMSAAMQNAIVLSIITKNVNMLSIG